MKATKEVLEKIQKATELAKENERTFVPSIFKTLIEQNSVRLSVPPASAKYLKRVPDHKIIVFDNESLSSLQLFDVDGHYVHGDFTKRQADGSVKPTVIRHFWVKNESAGKDITANVVVKEKTCLFTGQKTIIIDITEAPETSVATHVLRLGTTPIGADNEFMIPVENKCVRFDKITQEKIIKPVLNKKSSNEETGSTGESKLKLKKKGEVETFSIFKETENGPKRIIHLMHN